MTLKSKSISLVLQICAFDLIRGVELEEKTILNNTFPFSSIIKTNGRKNKRSIAT